MYEFFNDPVKPKYEEKGQICYMDTNSFIVSIKKEDIYVELIKDKKKFDTLNYNLERPYHTDTKNIKQFKRW